MTRYLPPVDGFDDGSPSYNTQVQGYVSAEPNTTAFAVGHLHDGYSSLSPYPQHAACAASSRISALGGANDDPHAWARRETFQADVEVSAHFFPFVDEMTESPGLSAQHLPYYSVFARAQGGSVTGTATTSVRWQSFSCYELQAVGTGADAINFTLYRYASGTPTQIAQTTVTSSITDLISWPEGFELRLLVRDEGSEVYYRAIIDDFTYEGARGYGPFVIFEGMDSSPLTGSGRCGFGMASARTYSSHTVWVADCCEWFQVAKSTNTDAILWRDEWVRLKPELSITSATDALSRSGNVLMSDYTCDQFTDAAEGSQLNQRTDESCSYDIPNGSLEAAVFMSQHRAESLFSQAQSISVTFTSGTGSGHTASIMLRGDYPGQTSFPTLPTSDVFALPYFKGYMVYAWSNDSSSQAVAIRRFTGDASGSSTVIASDTDTPTNLFPHGSAFELKAECQPVAGYPPQGDIETANVQLKVFLDGTQVVLGNASSGVTIDGSGTVIDAHEDRVSSGWGVGFHAGGDTTTRNVILDSFSREFRALEDLAPITTQNEAQGFSIAVAINDVLEPHYDVEIEPIAPLLSTGFASGHRMTQPEFGDANGPLERRLITFTAPVTTATEHHRLANFFDQASGVVVPFNFRDESGTNIPVAFVGGSLERAQGEAPNVYGTRFQLIELLNTA